MAEYHHQSELIADFDQLLGKFIRNFQQLDMLVKFRMIELGLGTSKPAEHVGLFVNVSFSELSFRAKLNILEWVLSIQIPTRPEYRKQKSPLLQIELARAVSAIKSIRKIEEKRNSYVHSFWWVMEQPSDSKELIPITQLKMKASTKNPGIMKTFSPETLRNLIDEIYSLQNELGESTGRLLGFLEYDEGKKTG
jgi:hypothetical protein